MCKENIEKIMKYKKFKENYFFNNQDIDVKVIKEKYSAYEEEVYGDSLCQIYCLLNEIEMGRNYLTNTNLVLILSTITFIYYYISLNILNLYNNTFLKMQLYINIIILAYTILKLINIHKYYLFILYKIESIKTKIDK